jgi:hypothetical protein
LSWPRSANAARVASTPSDAFPASCSQAVVSSDTRERGNSRPGGQGATSRGDASPSQLVCACAVAQSPGAPSRSSGLQAFAAIDRKTRNTDETNGLTACGTLLDTVKEPSRLGRSAMPSELAAARKAAALTAAARSAHPKLPAVPERRTAEGAETSDWSADPAATAHSGGRTQLAASIITRSLRARSSVSCSNAAATEESEDPRRPPARLIESPNAAPTEMPWILSSASRGPEVLPDVGA